MNTKIIASLATIAVVGAAAIGGTYAFFSSQRSSTGNTFTAGSVNLQLANISSSAWTDTVAQTWNFSAMAPGGTPQEATLRLKNIGSVTTEKVDLSLANATGNGLEKQLRITKLTLDGVNMLKGGAGADLSNYVAPTNCTVTLSGNDKITAAIAAAQPGAVICTTGTDYSTSWEGGPITIDRSVTIASVNGPAASKISAGIIVAADNVTIKGYTITPATTLGAIDSIYLQSGTGLTISDNDINGSGVSGTTRGIEVITGGDFSGGLISNNKIHGFTTGIYTNTHTGSLAIKNNEIYNTTAGIGGLTGADVQFNKFHDNSEAIGADNSSTNYTIKYNEFLNGDKVIKYGTWPAYDSGSTSIVAENNWWGDTNPADQVLGNVDYTPYAGGSFIGFVNGADGTNANGFADMQDLRLNPIVGFPFEMTKDTVHNLVMAVQLDGPTTGNDFQGGNLTTDMVVNISQ